MNGDDPMSARLAGAAAAAFAAAGQVPDPDDAAEQQRLRDQLARALGDSRIPCLGLWVLLSPSSGQDFATRQEMMREQETLEEGIVYGCVGADCR